jgi:hypothetical protein
MSLADKFAGALTVFSGLLVVVTGLQLWAYVQSERAFLVVHDASFQSGDLVVNGSPLVFNLKNPGKTVASVREFNLSASLVLRKGKLPNDTQYTRTPNDLVALTIAPGNEIHMRYTLSNPEVLTAEVVNALHKGDDVF